MKTYLRIIKIMFRNAVIRDLHIPGYVLAQVMSQLVEIAVMVVFFDILFAGESSLAGWSYYQVLFLYAFSKIITMSNNVLLRGGTADLATCLIRRGDLDLYLVKPVDAFTLVAIHKPRAYQVLSLSFYVILAVYALLVGHLPIGLVNALWFMVLGFLGFLLYFFLHYLTVLPAFWFIKLFSLQDMIGRIQNFTRYPAGAFPFLIKIALFALFPILTAMYIPVRILLYPVEAKYIIFMIGITVSFGLMTRAVWFAGLRRYGSASS